MDTLLNAENLCKEYNSISVINNFNIEAKEGESIALIGPSGAGKSTILHMLSGLDSSSSGKITYPKASLQSPNYLRTKYFGFIYQFHFLIDELTVLENILIASDWYHKDYALSLLKRFKILDKENSYPHELSGGQKQRVAIIRGLINFPKILFADEPTGNLDHENSKIIQDEILSLVKEYFMTAIIATHDLEFAHKMDKVIEIGNYDSGFTKKKVAEKSKKSK